jgi:hypothetical protein
MAEQYQTINKSGEEQFFPSLSDAVNEYKNAPDIVRIFFNDTLWCPKHKNQKLGRTAFQNVKLEEHFCNMSATYAGEQDADALYFVSLTGPWLILSESEFLAEYG